MTEVMEKSILHLLHRATQIGSDRFARELGDTGCTPRQLIVLGAIAVKQGASQTQLVGMTGVDRSTLADIVRRMQRRGLISRRRTKADARTYAITLTTDGRQMLDKGQPVLARIEREMLASVPPKRRADLVDLLEMLAPA